MQTIETTFTAKGFNHSQVWRDNQFAIYDRRKPNHSTSHFEAIRIQHHKANTWPNGKTSPDREAYPSTESWGVNGFTCPTLKHAQDKIQEWQSLPQYTPKGDAFTTNTIQEQRQD